MFWARLVIVLLKIVPAKIGAVFIAEVALEQ
ncbi:hypothetical protein FHS81_001151 [Pseudochelatococcus contaminans]|uniref:Uncharacterized protein n=1 Tax=Pseudochelatococcus contaminans TaxID=1538103 RepID=A0A7W5Z2U1_9HYPH|nr:hypothetical protein [Pseudochelatococcus contaminans]